MKLLFSALLFLLPFIGFSQATVNYSLLDSNENAVLRKNKSLEYELSIRTELTSIDRTPAGDLKLVFKKHDPNANSYDYDTYIFDKSDKCHSVSTQVSIGKLAVFLAQMKESGYRNNGENLYYNEKEKIAAKVESNIARKVFTVTYTRK